jgi:hypothetical protein
MSRQDKGKQSIQNPQTKHSKIQINRKIEKSLQVAQKRGTKILQVPNPADPLKSSSGEKAVQKAGFLLLQLLDLETGNHGLKNLQSLDIAKPKPGYPQIDIL